MMYQCDVGEAYYEVFGPEEAPAVMFSHGVAMDHRTFMPQIQALQDQYRVIVWDMPYHGKSPAVSRSLPYSNTCGDMMMGILDELRVEKAVLAGLSLGSLVIQKAADRYPERVAASIHISGASLYPRYAQAFKICKPFMPLMHLLPSGWLNRTFARHKALTEDTQEYLTETMARTGKPALVHLMNAMLDDMVQGLCGEITHPLLILVGDHDLTVLQNLSRRWHKQSQHSILAQVPQAHHILNQDNPQECNRHITAFLQMLRKEDVI